MPGTRKLGRVTAHRLAMLNGMATNLLDKGQIKTTYTRAKELSAVTDNLITLGKKGNLAAYRTALGILTRENVAKKLFDTIAPSYADVAGGYTQIYKLGPRRGDCAEMALIKLKDVKEEAPVEEVKPAKKSSPRKKAAVKEAAVKEAAAKEADAAPAKKKTTTRKKKVAETAPAAEAEKAPATETAE